MRTFLATSVASVAVLLTSPMVGAADGGTAPPPGSSAQLNVGSGSSAQLNVGSGSSAQLNVGTRLVPPEGSVAVPGPSLAEPELGDAGLRQGELQFDDRELRFDGQPELRLDLDGRRAPEPPGQGDGSQP